MVRVMRRIFHKTVRVVFFVSFSCWFIPVSTLAGATGSLLLKRCFMYFFPFTELNNIFFYCYFYEYPFEILYPDDKVRDKVSLFILSRYYFMYGYWLFSLPTNRKFIQLVQLVCLGLRILISYCAGINCGHTNSGK